jgi:lysophospholipase L1-like esterase
VLRRRGWLLIPVVIVLAVLLGTGSGTASYFSGSGSSSAAASSAGSWNLVGLGDSITAGQGCPGCVPFIDLYAREITQETSVPVTVTNLGVGGSTSADLLETLSDAGSAAARSVAEAEIVTVTIGANDFLPMLDTALRGDCGGSDGLACFDVEQTTLADNLTAILRRIDELRRGAPTAVRVTGVWNVFLDGAVATRIYGPGFAQWSSDLTQQVNKVIENAAARQGARYVDLFALFRGASGEEDDTALLAGDGDHPSQAGHEEIAEALARAGYAPLRAGQ